MNSAFVSEISDVNSALVLLGMLAASARDFLCFQERLSIVYEFPPLTISWNPSGSRKMWPDSTRSVISNGFGSGWLSGRIPVTGAPVPKRDPDPTRLLIADGFMSERLSG